ncbi:MAG: choice-of-anchor D domain-containing protein [Deltaproteobacteria bacterium]|nr:choice-of-anchor D domain-containing protein [Deltaproteobacteria bacterium]
MKKTYLIGSAVVLVLSAAALFLVSGNATGSVAHTGLTWQGPQTCLACHESQARDMYGSTHYQWQGPALYTVNGPDVQGKLLTAVNSYCISILGNWNACGSCHVGLGAQPASNPVPTLTDLQNIDCLMCHQKDYKRVKAAGVFVPDTAKMTITMDQAIQTVHLPERVNCLQCHAKGGGGDNNKRGDMALAHGTTADRTFDVHMATTGANLACQQCHTTKNHKIAGRGSDLRQTDLDVKMSCSTATCHPNKTASNGHVTADVNRHVGRVACQTCHISTYARNATDTAANETTEVYRDWQVPEFNVTLNRWEPTITRGGDLKPAYRFWNGASWNYSLKDPVLLDAATGAYATSRPEGGINDSLSKLYPFKYKKAAQPIADSLAMLIAADTAVYFAQGNYDAAVKAGLVNMGYPNTTAYRTIETDTFQLITHEVRPQGNALTCAQCHTTAATQMNLRSMGYTMKGTQSTTCTQCHGSQSIPSYTSLHNRHVSSQGYDCSYCHNFSRPERGLRRPTGYDATLPNVTAFGIPSTSTSLTVPVTAFTATDNVGVVGYTVTETSAKPTAGNPGWSVVQPTIYLFATTGSKTLYAWARDAAGNVSNSRSAVVNVSANTTPPPPPPPTDTQLPVVTAFGIPATATSLTVPFTSLTATDNVAVTGYLVTETSTKPAAGAAGWLATRPASYTFATAGSKTLYGWAKDAAGNVANSLSAAVTITLPTADTQLPVVTGFSIPATAASLTVPITTLTATDNVAVTGYLVTETSTKPAAGAAGWLATRPASYTFATAGSKTLYGWAKDAANNVANSLSAAVTITLPTAGAPDIATSASSISFGEVREGEQATRSLYVYNRGSAPLTVTQVVAVGTNASVFRPSATSFTVSPGSSYRLYVSFRPTDDRSYQATLQINSNDPDTAINTVTLSGRGED